MGTADETLHRDGPPYPTEVMLRHRIKRYFLQEMLVENITVPAYYRCSRCGEMVGFLDRGRPFSTAGKCECLLPGQSQMMVLSSTVYRQDERSTLTLSEFIRMSGQLWRDYTSDVSDHDIYNAILGYGIEQDPQTILQSTPHQICNP